MLHASRASPLVIPQQAQNRQGEAIGVAFVEVPMDRQTLLQRASEHIFSTGLEDSAARLGLANMKYGLAKIHLAQEALGMTPDATFVAAPDLTVTRNVNRWRSGFGYGGRITWGDGHQEWIPLDLKPNFCGMLVGGLHRLPARDTLLQRAQALQAEELSLDGIPLKWDFGVSNHFIALFRVTPLDDSSFLPYAFVIHGAGSELRGENAWGDGLYWDRSERLQRKAEILDTPFGPLRLLTGQSARDYYAFCQRVDGFAKERRLLIARRLFDDLTPYSNETHQGLVSMNDMVLGSHLVGEGEETTVRPRLTNVFPLTLRADLPTYLVRGRPNLSDAAIERLGLGERARRLGLYHRLRSANIIPHGGGYTFPHLRDVLSVIELGQERYFELSLADDRRQIVSDVRDLPYAYRGMEVVERVVELGLGELVARLDPVYVLKL